MKRLLHYHRKRIPILSWLIAPVLICWLGFNYIFGSMQQPSWFSKPSVLAESTSSSSNSILTGVSVSKYRFFHEVQDGFVTFWFDDAWNSQYTQAFSVLEPYKYKSALSVPTRAVETPNYMNWNTVKKLDSAGWEITSHSRSHTCDISKFTPETILSETLGAKEDLIARGILTDIYVTPCSSNSDILTTYIKKFYLTLRTGEGGINQVPVKDNYRLFSYSVSNSTSIETIRSWIQQTQLSKGWLILMFHQVDSSTGEYSITPEYFRSIVEEVSKSKLTVALPTEVLTITDLQKNP